MKLYTIIRQELYYSEADIESYIPSVYEGQEKIIVDKHVEEMSRPRIVFQSYSIDEIRAMLLDLQKGVKNEIYKYTSPDDVYYYIEKIEIGE